MTWEGNGKTEIYADLITGGLLFSLPYGYYC